MTDTQAPERIIKDCLLAAKCMEETSTFDTGQAILRDAAKTLEAVVAERNHANDVVDAAKEEIERLKATMKLAHDQYMGAGGSLRPQEVVENMKFILKDALEVHNG